MRGGDGVGDRPIRVDGEVSGVDIDVGAGISGLSAIDPTAGFRCVFAHALLGRCLPGE